MTEILTPTEILTIHMVSNDLTTRQIATRRRISESTVTTQLHKIGRKLGCSSRAAMVGECYRRGLLPLERP